MNQVSIKEMLEMWRGKTPSRKKSAARTMKKGKAWDVNRRWKHLISEAYTANYQPPLGPMFFEAHRKSRIEDRWIILIKKMVALDQNYGVCIKMMHYGLFKSFTLRALEFQ